MSSDESAVEPGHVEKARHAIHTLHTAHDDAATPMDRLIDQTTAILSRPTALFCFMAAIALWIGANILAGKQAIDPSPFPDLEFVVSAAALAIALLILVSQRRADRLADAREKMTLELSLQSAQKCPRSSNCSKNCGAIRPMYRIASIPKRPICLSAAPKRKSWKERLLSICHPRPEYLFMPRTNPGTSA